MSTRKLHNMRELEARLGISRNRLSAIVDGLGVPQYRGPKNAKCIDDEGLKRLTKALEPRVVTAAS